MNKRVNTYFFRILGDDTNKLNGHANAKTDFQKKEGIDQEKFLLCRQCYRIITHWSLKFFVDGTHEHTFANPHGIVFEIGCFRAAAGCIYVGPPTYEFSWFKGFMWQVAVCGSCLTHVGWFFSSSDLENFVGLILDRLVESD